MLRSGALVIVLDADDVVLAEIAAGLHLDQFEQDLAGILQGGRRAIGFVLANSHYFQHGRAIKPHVFRIERIESPDGI